MSYIPETMRMNTYLCTDVIRIFMVSAIYGYDLYSGYNKDATGNESVYLILDRGQAILLHI